VSPALPYNPPQPDQCCLPTVLARTKVKLRAGVKLFQPAGRKAIVVAVLDDLIGVHDDGDEEGEHHIDEEADEGVEIKPAVNPHRKCFFHGDGAEGCKHVITIDEGEEAFRGGHESLKLEMIRAKDDPASKGKANIEEESTNEKSEHVWCSSFHGEYQHIVGLEESKIAKDAKPDQQVPSTKHQTENKR